MTSRWCVGSFFELPLSGATVVGGEKAVLECHVAVTPAAEVTRYVDTSFAVRSLHVAENGATYLSRRHFTTSHLRRGDLSKCPT